MGANTSKIISQQDINSLSQITNFSETELQVLYNRFQHLDAFRHGSITFDKLASIPELAVNPLSFRLQTAFQAMVNGSTTLNFEQFARILDVFHPKCKRVDKLNLIFCIYDVDGDGFISFSDLFIIVKDLVGQNLEDFQIRMIVHETMNSLNLGHD